VISTSRVIAEASRTKVSKTPVGNPIVGPAMGL
jgi:hypothetical protein